MSLRLLFLLCGFRGMISDFGLASVSPRRRGLTLQDGPGAPDVQHRGLPLGHATDVGGHLRDRAETGERVRLVRGGDDVGREAGPGRGGRGGGLLARARGRRHRRQGGQRESDAEA